MQFDDNIKSIGNIEMIIETLSGEKEIRCFHNTVLKKGREALAKVLANEVGDTLDFFISRMIFGDGGTAGGSPKAINAERNGLFGLVRANKPVISSINSSLPTQVILTSVVAFSEANGFVLNEMALQMNSGDLYSMTTFPDLSKTSSLQLTFNWSISFV